jgi:transcription-repair coupling factor (superfamily II helicase)
VYLERDVETLPARGVLYGADVAPAAHVLGQRQRALAALELGGGVVVADAVALLERFIPLALQPPSLALVQGAESPFDEVLAALASLGYERAEQVRERGEFAVRGGIIDVYPSTGDPVRAEFWGDTVESLRRFSVFSQRAVAEVPRCLVTTASEVDRRRGPGGRLPGARLVGARRPRRDRRRLLPPRRDARSGAPVGPLRRPRHALRATRPARRRRRPRRRRPRAGRI